MTIVQEILQRDRTEAPFVAGLKTKSTQELRRFIACPWTASILSPEEIEEIYQTLQQTEMASLDWSTENFVEMPQD